MLSYIPLHQPLQTLILLIFFFFNDTATTEIYTLSLHDALPISRRRARWGTDRSGRQQSLCRGLREIDATDRKSTRLNSSHSQISYAVFCLKKNKKYGSSETFDRHLALRTSRHTVGRHVRVQDQG